MLRRFCAFFRPTSGARGFQDLGCLVADALAAGRFQRGERCRYAGERVTVRRTGATRRDGIDDHRVAGPHGFDQLEFLGRVGDERFVVLGEEVEAATADLNFYGAAWFDRIAEPDRDFGFHTVTGPSGHVEEYGRPVSAFWKRDLGL